MKHLILILSLFLSVSAHAAPWLCAEADIVYDSQSFCEASCNELCIELTPSGGTCSGAYKNYAFDRSTNKTYAITTATGKWTAFTSRLAIIRDSRTNGILKDILNYSGQSEAWIGLNDPNLTQNFNSVNDTRFKWRDGTVLNYRNWAEGQPDNKLNPADIGQTDIYGEHYGTMDTSGLWSDSGGNVLLNALVEFSGVQSCVSGTLPSEDVQPIDMENAFCGGDSSNCYLCTDSTDIFKCTQGTGGFLCPQGQQNCNMNYADAGCPAGTVLNPNTDKCEKAANITCPAGMTYDSGLDRCVATAICNNGGILNPVSDKCEIVITSGNCPTGYTFDPSLNICKATPNCPAGTYNTATNRCEAVVTKTCPAGYSLNGNKCQANPICSSGTYNSSAKKCVLNASVSCPSGSYNPASGKCETVANNGYSCSYEIKGSSGGTTYEASYIYKGIYPTPVPNDPNTIIDREVWEVHDHLKNTVGICYGLASYFDGKNGLVQIPSPNDPDGPDHECFDYITNIFLSLRVKDPSTCVLTQNSLWGEGITVRPGETKSKDGYIWKNTSSQLSCTNGSFNPVTGKCESIATITCPSGFTYDSALGMCVRTPTCNNGGTFNSSTHKCELTVSNSCPAGMTYSSASGKCVASSVCSQGIFDSVLDICKVSASTLCPAGYVYNSSNKKCQLNPICNQGGYSPTVDKCVIDASKNCPTGTSLTSSNLCQANPICSPGTYDTTQNKCFTGASCPTTGKPCVNINGTYKCSTYDCYSSNDRGNYQNEDTTEGENDKQADGEFDEAGQCLGTIYIFNGNDRRCRPSGVQTGFSNCCEKGDRWFGLAECSANEKALSSLRNWGKQDGQCKSIGSYCAEKWLSVCVQRKQTYCCFGSSLARIIAEQGREQLGLGWGNAKSPDCRGFTPEEFQKLDFDKIDFSEWFEHEVEPNMRGNIEANIQNAFENIPVPVVQ